MISTKILIRQWYNVETVKQLLGDFNAKGENENNGYVTGGYGLEE